MYDASSARPSGLITFLVSSAILLKRCIGVRRAWLPLVAVGLSPTLLYFNSLGTSYALDVELCELVAQFLHREGFEAELVHDGARGLEAALNGNWLALAELHWVAALAKSVLPCGVR